MKTFLDLANNVERNLRGQRKHWNTSLSITPSIIVALNIVIKRSAIDPCIYLFKPFSNELIKE